MTKFTPLKKLSTNKTFKEGDVFVLFGELFNRGYANGLVKCAQEKGMKIIGVTVGRREGKILRNLTDEEKKNAEEYLGGEIINIPLEAGFDMEELDGEGSIIDMLNVWKKDNWNTLKLDWAQVTQRKKAAEKKFKDNLSQVVCQLQKKIPENVNIFFAHIMAGGIPRSKIIFVLANKIFKGKGDRHLSSDLYWKSELGRLCDMSFNEVTADTFQYLIEGTTEIYKKNTTNGKHVVYTAYGYHGCEILTTAEKYEWQTYTPYQQGHAKKRLEKIAISYFQKNIPAIVFNCPEIRTNSSDLFLGVELSLFPFLKALQKENNQPWTQELWDYCQSKLIDGNSLSSVITELQRYYSSPIIRQTLDFEAWPMENSLVLSELMVGTSEKITALHKDKKDLITDHLSQYIIEGVGNIMFNEASQPQHPVLWLGHDIIAKEIHRRR